MKVLLIYPPFLEKRLSLEDVEPPPMGLFWVAEALIRAGHRVEAANLFDQAPGAVDELMDSFRPDVVGFSILCANRWGALDMAARIKEKFPKTPCVLGGVGAAPLWELLLEYPQVDYLVLGEGDTTFPRLLSALENHGDVRDIPGLAFRRGGEPFCTGPAQPISDLDSLAIPARHFSYNHLSLSRGCPNRCTFCGSPNFWGPKTRFRGAASFVEEMAMLVQRGHTFFYVSDDTFTLKKDLAISACRQILERGLSVNWAAISRVDRVDEDVLYWMRKAGCIQVSYGVEHGNAGIRRLLAKEFSEPDIRRAFALTASMAMMPRAYFIYGCPGETDATIADTCRCMDEIRPLGAVFYILDIFPGTRLYEDYKKRSGRTDAMWRERVEDILYCQTDPGMSDEQVLAWGRKLRGHFHSNLPVYMKTLEPAGGAGLAPEFSDFYARLGATLVFGDWAGEKGIPDKNNLALEMFERSLRYKADAQAFLGMGVVRQKAGEHDRAAESLAEGAARFPDNPDLALALALSFLHLGRTGQARNLAKKFSGLPQARQILAACGQ